MTDLLDILGKQAKRIPLPEKLRPKDLKEFVGQKQLLGDSTPLRNLFKNRDLASMIFWGPPGVGKTSLARLFSENYGADFRQLSAVSSGVSDLRKIIETAKENIRLLQRHTVLFIDEIHRYNKAQQDALLPYVEDGTLYLIGATTENPSFNVIPALLSRLLIFKMDYLSRDDVKDLILKGINEFENLLVEEASMEFIINYANGDGRSALNLLEVAYQCTSFGENNLRAISPELLRQLAQQGRVNYDRDGDEHYDHASAYQKSMRGSDADAAIYWLAKMIASGEDPRFIARRLIVTASEDVGNADPMALIVALGAAESVDRLGMPEARIPLAQATIYISRAPKSNQAIKAVDKALCDIREAGKSYPVPMHLRDSHYKDAKKYGHGVGYLYSHDNAGKIQKFLPDVLSGSSYVEDLQ